MKGLVLSTLGLLVITGCGSGDGVTNSPRGPSVVTDGNYEVGKDLEPGAYTAALDCIGTTASVAGYEVGDPNPEPLLGGSVQVRGHQRVTLKSGQFFTSEECPGGWRREGEGGAPLPDPATVRGGCSILIGDGLVAQALTIARNSAEHGGRRSTEVQDQLFSIVASHNPELWEGAGELVDLLDDPAGYGEPSAFTTRVDRAVATIEKICGDS